MRLTDAATTALWSRLQAFELDPPGLTRTISARVAEEQGWTAAHTRRVVEEYRRFLLLTQVVGRPVSPSRAVDAVWHTHLLYSRDYWERLCGEVLGKPLHHDPNPGGADEEARHHTQYLDTLAAYERIFGEAPPADLWTRGPAEPPRSLDGLSEDLALKARLMAGEFRPSLLALLCGGEERVTATAQAGLYQRGLVGFVSGKPVLSDRVPRETDGLTAEESQLWHALWRESADGQSPKMPLTMAYPALVREATDMGLWTTPKDHADRVAARRANVWRQPLRWLMLGMAVLLWLPGVGFFSLLSLGIVLWWVYSLREAYRDTAVQPTAKARQVVEAFTAMVPKGTTVSLHSPLLATVVAAGVIGAATAADLEPLQSAIVPGRQEGGGCGGGGGCSGGSGGGDGGGGGCGGGGSGGG